MKFIVIGITDQPHPWFQPDVLELIKDGKVFSGGKRHHEIVAPLLPDGAKWIDITVPLDHVFAQYTADEIIVFASGDPLFFGFANTIKRKMPDADIVVHATFNSLQVLAHRLVMPYHDMRIVSLTGRPWPEFDKALIERAEKIGVLTDKEHTPAAIARRMLDYGYTYYNMYVGEHLGNPELEKVSSLTLEEAAQRSYDYPNCILLVQAFQMNTASDRESSTNTCRPRLKRYGLPDSGFVLLDGREKMITKMPIRLLTLQVLDLPRHHVFWDIGFCTGSVSIEARLQFPHLHVVAFEIRPECETIIHENARRFGAPGIDVHMGDFPILREFLVCGFAYGFQAVQLRLALVLFEVYKPEREKQASDIAFGGTFFDSGVTHGLEVVFDHELCVLGVCFVTNGTFCTCSITRIRHAKILVR